MKKTLKVVALLLVIVLLLGVFFVIYKLSNNFTTDIKTFYLVIDNKIITENQTNISLQDKTIAVHSVGETISGKQGFSYEIRPSNSARSFVLYVDGKKHTLADKTDYAKCFDVEKTDTSIKVKSTNMLTILQRAYGDSNIEIPLVEGNVCYFTLLIKSADGSKNIALEFIFRVKVEKIEFDKTHLEF